MLPNIGSITRPSPFLLTGFPGAGFPAFKRYYERAKTSRFPSRRTCALQYLLALHQFVSLLQAHCCNGADAAMPGVRYTGSPLPGPLRRRNLDLPGYQDTLVYICPALGPRMDFHARPFRRFNAAPAIAITKAPSIVLISRLNHTAFVPAVYASCRHY